MTRFLKSMLAIAAVTAVSSTCSPARASSPPYHTTVMATNCGEAPATVHWENIDGALFLVIHLDGDSDEEGGFFFPGIKGHSVQPLTFLAKLGGDDSDLFWESEDTNGVSRSGGVETSPVPGHPGYFNCKVTLSDFDFPSNAKFQYLFVFFGSEYEDKATASITHIEVGGVLSTPNVNHVENECD
jgi:hypothetical protein